MRVALTLYGIDGEGILGTGVTRTIPRAKISASRTKLMYSIHSVAVSDFTIKDTCPWGQEALF